MSKQPEALRLAQGLERMANRAPMRNAEDDEDLRAAAELRRLVAVNGQLLDAIQTVMQIDVRGHTLASRLQFTSQGRHVLSVVDAAIAAATSAPSAQEEI